TSSKRDWSSDVCSSDLSIWEVPKVLLARRADNGNWAPVTGICEPGEEVAQTAVREVKEEVGLDAKVEALLGVGMVGPTTFDNGDIGRASCREQRGSFSG